VVENVVRDQDDEVIVASVRARKGPRGRCGICQRKCPGYDQGEGRRRWRALDCRRPRQRQPGVGQAGTDWTATVVADWCKNATRCMDPFHVVQWCTNALYEVSRDVWNTARKDGMTALAGDLKEARSALWKSSSGRSSSSGATPAPTPQPEPQ
jgi:transposase